MEQLKERERQQETTPASTQGPRMNLGRAVAAHCFPGHQSGELRAKPIFPSQVSAPSVRLKEVQNG
jgi:hypothetical protein